MSFQRLSQREADGLLKRLDDEIRIRFPRHPFQAGINKANFAAVMNEYAAMSIAFPYLQAGAVYENYRRCVEHRALDANVKVTAAVGAFLALDEFGGHGPAFVDRAGALAKVIDVDRHFHSSLLMRDLGRLLDGSPPLARPGPATRRYLDQLHEGLSASTGNHNVAHMVGFERHANEMIKALWNGTKAVFGLATMDGLEYFEAHIGSDSAGEAIHVRLTESMIASLVSGAETDTFLESCIAAYAFNLRWCQDVLQYADELVAEACPAD